MNTTAQQPFNRLSPARTAILSVSCILIFIIIAVICGILTSWIAINPLKVFIREVLLRAPLTIYILHLFAKSVIKVYDPSAIYGRLKFKDLLKWTGIGLIIPLSVWGFYYFSRLAIPFGHTIALQDSEQTAILVRWLSVSLAAGLTEQVLFRGHLFMIMRSRYSIALSVFITSLIFGLLHIFMLNAFDLVSAVIVVVGGVIAGTMFSLIFLYARVIWLAAIVHFIWDVFFIGKIIAISTSQADANHIIIPFKLMSNKLMFTGGNFGIESAAPSFVIYLVVTACLYYLYQGNRQKALS